MAFTVQLYNFTKRENSTARPSGQGTPYACIVRTGTGILNPTIELEIGLATSPASFNYAYIAEFQRYYFIEEWQFSERLWTAQLKVDVLATYKTVIGSSNLYALRAANNYDGTIIDNLYPTKTGSQFEQILYNTDIWTPYIDYGVVVIGVVSSNPHYGSLDYYAMSLEALNDLTEFLLTDLVNSVHDFSDLDASLELQLNLIDPLQYIKSAVYIPVGIGNIPGTYFPNGGNIKIFKYNCAASGAFTRLGPTPYFEKTVRLDIPKHPQTNARGNYVNAAPYTNIAVAIPPFGVFEIDTTVACTGEEVEAVIRVDVPTGKAVVSLYIDDTLIRRSEGSVGVPIQLSQVTRDYYGAAMGLAQGATSAVGSFLSMNYASMVGAGISAIGNAYTSLIPRSSSMGSGGSYAQLTQRPRLDAQFFIIVDDDIAHNGRPLCQIVQPANLGGYMLIQDGDVAIDGTSSEARSIRSYLEGGFYYE